MASKVAKMLFCRRKMVNYSTYKVLRSFSIYSSLRTNHTAAEHEEKESTKTHFGYQTVDETEKQQKVNEVFGNVAEKYDLMNDAMSGGVHRLWKDYFIEKLAPQPGTKVIDVAGGTGDIAFRFLKFVENEESFRALHSGARFDIDVAAEFPELGSAETSSDTSDDEEQPKETHVTVCDINPAMLEVGQKRALELGYHKGIKWMEGNAEILDAVESNTFDAYTIAFGIRNCTHIDKVLEEAYRVLKPGGRFMCLEFSHVPNPVLRWIYDEYSFQVIPPMGQIIARDWHSYQYLVESIRKFPKQEEFSTMIREAGFKAAEYLNHKGESCTAQFVDEFRVKDTAVSKIGCI